MLLITGDWHLRYTNPVSRIDSFFNTQFNKIKQIFTIAKENNCKAIICPGDLFDSPNASLKLLERYATLFLEYSDIDIYTVWGQHDMRFRKKDNTALQLFNSIGLIKILNNTPVKIGDTYIYGTSYDEFVPEPNTRGYNILVIHKTVLDKKMFDIDSINPNVLFKKNYNLVISGDYHYPVYYEYGDKIILNCGAVVRKTLADKKLKPHVYVLTSGKRLNKIYLDIKDKVFEQKNKITVSEDKQLQEFIDAIKQHQLTKSLDFITNLNNLVNQANVSDKVKDIISDSIKYLS